MRPWVRVTPSAYRKLIKKASNMGRFPIARVIYGYIGGRGWGFLNPWEQLAIFPNKGTLAGISDPARRHERFAIARVFPTWRTERHPNHEDPVTGRYWWGLAWRASWDKPRLVLLDPDRVRMEIEIVTTNEETTVDPAKAQTMGAPAPGQMVDSAGDQRVVNNVMRHGYRVLTDEEKARMQAIKDKGLELWELINSFGTSRELSLAKTAAEESVMWAVKHLTA